MKTSKKTVNTYPLGYTDYEDIREETFGAIGTPERSQHEFELKADLLAERLKQLRKHANLTQTELGERIGVKKAQISKLEKDASSVSVSTMFKLLNALHATVTIKMNEPEKQLSALVLA